MNRNKKISVILPTHNRAVSLITSVQSVLNQTIQDFELFIIDDASTDSTLQTEASLKDPRITAIRLDKNEGGGNARNAGIFKSTGEYIAFIDDDDQWLPEKLQIQIAFMEQQHLDLSYCATKKSHWSRFAGQVRFNRPRSDNLRKAIMQDNFIGPTSSIIVRRENALAINGFDPQLPALQDWDFYIRLINQGVRVLGINQPLVSYNKLDENSSISRSYLKFSRAAGYLKEKYHDNPYLRCFKSATRRIVLKRVIASPNFRREFVSDFFK
jgi:glycosyltransferase involved in cell wall biosynthesis